MGWTSGVVHQGHARVTVTEHLGLVAELRHELQSSLVVQPPDRVQLPGEDMDLLSVGPSHAADEWSAFAGVDVSLEAVQRLVEGEFVIGSPRVTVVRRQYTSRVVCSRDRTRPTMPATGRGCNRGGLVAANDSSGESGVRGRHGRRSFPEKILSWTDEFMSHGLSALGAEVGTVEPSDVVCLGSRAWETDHRSTTDARARSGSSR
jgi:hypothetical protein